MKHSTCLPKRLQNNASIHIAPSTLFLAQKTFTFVLFTRQTGIKSLTVDVLAETRR